MAALKFLNETLLSTKEFKLKTLLRLGAQREMGFI